MNQLLSRPKLKDYAKGALEGNYKKAVLALFLVVIVSLAAQFVSQFLSGFLLTFGLIFRTLATTNISPEQLALQMDINHFAESYNSAFVVAEYIGLTLCTILTNVFSVGTGFFCLSLACKREASASQVFYGFQNNLKKALAVSAIHVLASQLYSIPLNYLSYLVQYSSPRDWQQIGMVCLILLCGTLIYLPIALCLSQVYFLMLDFPNLTAIETIKLSNQVMKNYKLKLFLLQLSFLPLTLLSLLTFRIGDLWLIPYKNVTYAFFFLNLMQARAATQSPQTY